MTNFTRHALAKSFGAYINALAYYNGDKAALTAYRLFSSPRAGRFKSGLPVFLEPQKHAVIEHADHKIQTYRWGGNNKRILLVHGWESNASRWERLLPFLLNQAFDVLAMDAPAHGLSTGVEFNLPLYATSISRCIQEFQPDFMIGHSIGGAASLLSQHLSPDSGLKKMVLLGSPAEMSVILDNFKRLLGLNGKSRALLDDYFVRRFGKGVEAYSAAEYCGNISIPTLLAHDKEDDVVLYDEALKIAGIWPHAQLVTTSGLGHSMHDDSLYRDIVDFLR
jgi:pimeloyl-ACP methyl ester carboxylesterase